jgi:hypothetical protein
MARNFTRASSHYLERSAALVTAVPLTMACWFNSTDVTVRQDLFCITNGASGSEAFIIAADGATGGDPIKAIHAGGGAGIASSSSGFSANTWHHACGVFVTNSSRTAYIDGGSAVNETTAVSTPTGLDTTSIGRVLVSGAGTNYMSGRIAEVGIWDVALDAAEVAALGKGVAPPLIRPQSLIAYWPLFGLDASELDRWKNKYDMTVTGAVKGEHRPMYYPVGV